ncbi:Retinoblastoma-related protein [Acorus calamus]|uniref:Retinoblastoma-related protein n=1 Tax=Acorus calamus TaxID=4465 RepID=A0AAV9F061_ACOCL|nr:Retinoblastoma-related protein [Acorus calamus]
MEDVKPLIRSSVDDGGSMETRFADLCKSLSLDESALRAAIALFRETKHLLLANMSVLGSGTLEENERLWSAFVLYSVKRLREEKDKQDNSGDGFSLCQILRATKLSVVDFFKEVPQCCLKAGHILNRMYGANWEKRLEVKELQANFTQLSDLSKFYKRAYLEFFIQTSASVGKQAFGSSRPGYISDYHYFGWLLFLALRVHAFSCFKDLATCANGLISILAILFIHVPVSFRNFDIRTSQILAKKSNKGVELLQSLCAKYNTSEEELRGTMEKANKLIVDILQKKHCPASECKNESLENINTEGLTYFEDLMDWKSLRTYIKMLEKDYDDAVRNKVELDERMFVDEGDSLLATGSLSGGAMSGSKRKHEMITSPVKMITSPMSPPCSPTSPAYSSKFALTPVSTAMTTAKWLRNVISPLPSNPSSEFGRFLSSCDKDVTNDVTRRASIILGAIFPNSALGEWCGTSLIDSIWAEQRKMEALKLYYRVLEAICRAESQTSNGNNLTPLLANERFHRCMLACSAELVLATHKTVSMMFPAVLERTGITAFDLSKVIEGFVRHEESLPRELRRHLNNLEERLLESMAWEKGSSMYDSLIVARPSLAAEINRLGLLAEPMPSLDAIAMHHNVPAAGLPPLPAIKHDISSDKNGGAPSPKRFCTDYRSVLVERNSFTSPTKDRLNSLKSKLALHSVFARTGQEHVDIITFYNEVFIPSVKPLLVEVDSGVSTLNNNRTEDNKIGDGQCPCSPRVSPFPSLPDMSPKKVSAGHNVYVSPLRSSKMDILLSPSSKSYYACIGESTHAYQSPSKDLTEINNRLNGSGRKVSGRLNFDSLVSDSLVAGSLCPQNGPFTPFSSVTSLNLAMKYEQPDP